MNRRLKIDSCDLIELKKVLSNYIEKNFIDDFIFKMNDNKFINKNEYFYTKSDYSKLKISSNDLGMLILDNNYYVNIKLSTLYLFCHLLDIEMTNGFLSLILNNIGKNKPSFYKINEENAEKCILLSILKQNEFIIDNDNICSNLNFKCRYKNDCGDCIIQKKNVDEIITSFLNKNVITNIGDNKYQYNFWGVI